MKSSVRRGADILADAERRSRRAAVVIARTDAERLSVRLSKDVCEEKAREMKKGEREDRQKCAMWQSALRNSD